MDNRRRILSFDSLVVLEEENEYMARGDTSVFSSSVDSSLVRIHVTFSRPSLFLCRQRAHSLDILKPRDRSEREWP